MYRSIALLSFCMLLFCGCQQPYGTSQRPMFNGGPLFADNFGPTGNGNWWRDGNTNPWWQANRNPNQQLANNANVPWWERGNQSANSGQPNLTQNRNSGGFNSVGYNNSNGDPRQAQLIADLNKQVQDLQQRLGRFDNVNNNVETEIASLQQKLQIASDHNYQLRQQLADSAVQLQQMQNNLQQTEQRAIVAENQARQINANAQQAIRNASVQTSQNPGSLAGAPTIRANNSLMAKLPNLQIGGVHARMDGDVIRVEIPSDPLFVPGSYQIQASHQNMLTQLSQAIRQHFPRQVVGVEAHWDNTPIQPATTTHHQLTATQSLAVIDYMQRLGVPQRQMFGMALGSNRPKYASASSQDRRVDIVIYPETFDQN